MGCSIFPNRPERVIRRDLVVLLIPDARALSGQMDPSMSMEFEVANAVDVLSNDYRPGLSFLQVC